jgi:hypothetical protein
VTFTVAESDAAPAPNVIPRMASNTGFFNHFTLHKNIPFHLI